MLGKVHILCAVRDRSVVQNLSRNMDDGESCTFQIVSDGRAALAACKRNPPDVLVIDAVLPGADGLGVVDRLQDMLGSRMPRVIGGAEMAFAARGFLRRGAHAVVQVPWKNAQLRDALEREIEEIRTRINWDDAQAACCRAGALLEEMGMHASLKGFTYLSWAAALAHSNEAWLFAVGERLYTPIAQRFGTTQASVERLIRHAVESTMSASRSRGVYGLFGNTIDPAKGKPTNAQIIGMLVQRMRVS